MAVRMYQREALSRLRYELEAWGDVPLSGDDLEDVIFCVDSIRSGHTQA
jgi:hypothetical protein